jgi:hypothetical protein
MSVQLPQDFQAAQADAVLEAARPALNLPRDVPLRVDAVTQTPRKTEIHFSCTLPVQLTPKGLGDAAGIQVDVSANGSLEFDQRGELVDAQVAPTDPHALDAVRDQVNRLVANDQIYFAAPDEKINPDQLRTQGKPWYVQTDAQGRRRLKRAYIA